MNAPSFVRARLDSWRALVAPASPTLYSALVAALFAVALALLNGVLIVQAVNLYHAFAIGAPLHRAVVWIYLNALPA